MIKITKNIDEANFITHGGTFHADDVFATIFLEKVFGDVLLCRVNELTNAKEYSNKIIYDIGNGVFDHHQLIAEIRPNGIKYSSVGLLFKKYGLDYLKNKNIFNYQKVYEMLDKDLIMQIDAIDNGIFPDFSNNYKITTLSDLVSYFNKNWNEEKDLDDLFLKATKYFTTVWDVIEKKVISKVEAEEILKKALKNSKDNILVLDKYIPYKDYVIEYNELHKEKIILVIFPSNRGGYAINTIKKNFKTNENILDFPKKWGGKSPEELEKLTGIKTFRFCHKDLFCAAADTLIDALQIAKEALKKKN